MLAGGTVTCHWWSLPTILAITLALDDPFKALYRRNCRTSICWDEVEQREPSKVELIHQTNDVVKPLGKDFKQLKVDKRVI